jgi:hypothetical protein
MKVPILTPPQPIDTAEGEQWLRLLRYCAGGKIAPVARLLGKSPATLYRWEYTPPEDWYWREVFRVVVELHVRTLRSLSSKTKSSLKREQYETRVRVIEKRLSALPSERYFLQLNNTMFSPQYRAALDLLDRLLTPGEKTLYTSVILPAMRDEGLSPRTLGRAADEMGVEKGRDGYQGPAWWRLPRREED